MPKSFDQPVSDDLVARARNGEHAAHAALYDAFARPVYTLAWRLTGRSESAEDVVQDTFVEVIRNIAGFRDEAPLGFWIRRIAVNKCLMHFRSAWQRLRSDLAPAELDAIVTPAAAAPHARIDLETLLMHLPAAPRAVVWLHDVEGYTHREIGALMGKTASYSKSQLARAHAALRAAFAPGHEPVEVDDVEAEEVRPCTPRSLTY
jgi:RNA polymerase sigma-70 factor (ECF subfamily)